MRFPTPLGSIYIWADVTLLNLEYGRQGPYVNIHPLKKLQHTSFCIEKMELRFYLVKDYRKSDGWFIYIWQYVNDCSLVQIQPSAYNLYLVWRSLSIWPVQHSHMDYARDLNYLTLLPWWLLPIMQPSYCGSQSTVSGWFCAGLRGVHVYIPYRPKRFAIT